MWRGVWNEGECGEVYTTVPARKSEKSHLARAKNNFIVELGKLFVFIAQPYCFHQ